MSEAINRGGFTLPGESGYEQLTLDLARRWGADVIRDSDGTRLSDEILDAGYGIYSTVCPIREHNPWIRENPACRQQTFLCTAPRVAEGESLSIRVMDDFLAEQFEPNDSAAAMAYWRVDDRTANREVPADSWHWADGCVTIETTPYHEYTVSFMAWRIWEEISMYNHLTNGWDKEHLMQLNPYRPEAQAYLKAWMGRWLADHPATTVVRFTALFYNFVWIWGSSEENQHLFTDWASYDFTVSPEALEDFSREYGYRLTAEDFVRQGKYNATHRVPSQKKRDWMEFIGRFVRRLTAELVAQVHADGKQAYVFYDDSWVGMEPYNGHFEEMGFDGIIKCVFNGYEARLCAGVPAKTHEIRFHPYLFPVGLGGAPTFSDGGQPGRDALTYWVRVRRALLRQKIERAGLGGYLHLTQGHPDFLAAMDQIMAEFRQINALHDAGAPEAGRPVIGVLTAWGSLRTWTLSGHFHETYMHPLIHVIESLSGLPYDVRFLSFEDVKAGALDGINVLINCGKMGDAWSGGELWDDAVVETLTAWVYRGGALVGIDEPSAAPGHHRTLRMAHVLGVDIDRGEYACHGAWKVHADPVEGLIPAGAVLPPRHDIRLTDAHTRVLAETDGMPLLTLRRCGEGCGMYLSGYALSAEATRLLHQLLAYLTEGTPAADGLTDNPAVECAVFAGAGKLVLANSADTEQEAAVTRCGKAYRAVVPACGMKVLDL